MTHPRDFPENPVRCPTDDVIEGIYVFPEHVDPATNPHPLPEDQPKAHPRSPTGEYLPVTCPTCQGTGEWAPSPEELPMWVEWTLRTVTGIFLLGLAFLVVRLIGR